MAQSSSVIPLRPRAPALDLADPEQDRKRLALALQEGKAWAEQRFVEEYRGQVARILTKILGHHADLEDLVQEVFIRALDRVHTLREVGALGSWLNGVTVFVARETIRKRRRRRWLILASHDELPELESPDAAPEDRAALRAFYEVLTSLSPDEQIAFALRYVEGLELTEIALACDVSLSTAKRRIKSAENDFLRRARRHDVLSDWLERGGRWSR